MEFVFLEVEKIFLGVESTPNGGVKKHTEILEKEAKFLIKHLEKGNDIIIPSPSDDELYRLRKIFFDEIPDFNNNNLLTYYMNITNFP